MLDIPDDLLHLVPHFGASLVRKGFEYFQENRHRITKFGRHDATIKIQGTSSYTVFVHTLFHEGEDLLSVNCTCPYAEREPFCKHGWCALLALASRKWPPLNSNLLHLVGTQDGDWEEGESPPDSSFFSDSAMDRMPAYSMMRRTLTLPRQRQRKYGAPPQYLLVCDSYGPTLIPGRLNARGDSFKRFRDLLPFVRSVEDQEERFFLHQLEMSRYGHAEPDDDDYERILPRAAEQGRLFFEKDSGHFVSVVNDSRTATLRLMVTQAEEQDGPWHVRGALSLGNEISGLDEAFMRRFQVLPGKLALRIQADGTTALFRFESSHAAQWVRVFSMHDVLHVPPSARNEFLADQLEQGDCQLDLPGGHEITHHHPELEPVVRLVEDRAIQATVSFRYETEEIAWSDARHAVFARGEQRSVIHRNDEAEERAIAALAAAGFSGKGLARGDTFEERGTLKLKKHLFSSAITTLLEHGFRVYGEKGRYRRLTRASTRVSSGMDWFDLHGRLEFDDLSLDLPAVLRLMKKRLLDQRFVALSDGTMGLLPDDWLARLSRLKSTPEKDGALRFSYAQVGIVHALGHGTAQEHDLRFDQLSKLLFERQAAPPVKLAHGFLATLRPYQEEGVAWLSQLGQLGLGACLADDMGLGKTVQVLALLHLRASDARKRRAAAPPSLVIAPRSLVENWASEAARFCPKLRGLVHLGPERAKSESELLRYDLIVTSFTTLRLDRDLFTSLTFDTIVVDEAQNMKNASAQTSQVIKALESNHRIAVTGTPVENHLGDLWSIFDFLNPGMLAFLGRGRGAPSRLDEAATQMLRIGVRPFLLRRTKDQVASDLPARTEQAWRLDLPTDHKRLYDELAGHYRARIDAAKKVQNTQQLNVLILEALLRLRQAACDPRLLDENRPGIGVKIEQVCESLATLKEEGRKALVFSQFTGFLKLLSKELDERDIGYEYLDGSTTKRPQVIERFRQRSDCPAFLVSLKAGGVGLNLIEADTVFLLDPWWNPAAEAQAIDRTHRIGQQKPVFAWRLIAQGTIEEKVLDLQEEKRALAQAVLDGDPTKLTQKDLLALLE